MQKKTEKTGEGSDTPVFCTFTATGKGKMGKISEEKNGESPCTFLSNPVY